MENSKKDYYDIILNSIIGVIAAVNICMLFMHTLRYTMSLPSVLILSLFTMLALNIIFYSKKNFIVFAVFLLFFVIIFSLYMLGLSNSYSFWGDFIIWLKNPTKVINSPYESLFSFAATNLIIIFFTVFGFVCIVKARSFVLYTISSALLYFGMAISGFSGKYIHFIIMLGIGLYIVLSCFYKKKYDSIKLKSEKIVMKKYQFTFIILIPLLIFSILLGIIKTDDAPLFKNLSENISGQIGSEKLGIYGEVFGDGKLGGDVDIDNTLMLEVKSNYDDLYLEGNAYEIYKGNKWETDLDVTVNKYEQDELTFPLVKLENTEGIKIITNDNYNNSIDHCFKEVNAEVTYVRKFTNSLFTLPNTESVDFNLGFPKISAYENELLKNSGNFNEGFRYNVQAVLPLHETIAYENAAMNSNINVYQPYSTGDLGELYIRSKKLYDEYTKTPDIPESVKNLAIEITKDKNSNYEKAKAIEEYLRSKYSYTLTPGPIPAGKDFVEYFLFTGKKGYCTYFASAMTVMCQSLGIPARYVEGFVAGGVKNERDVYEVTAMDAHAWTEIYFPGLGFIVFEPTASSLNVNELPPSNITPPENTETPAVQTSPAPESTPTQEPSEGVLPSPSVTPNSIVSPSPTVQVGLENIYNSFWISFICLILLVLVIILVIFLRNIFRIRAFKLKCLNGPERERILLIYREAINYLGYIAGFKQPWQTMEEYKIFLDSNGCLRNNGLEELFTTSTAVFLEVRYGNSGDSSKNVARVSDLLSNLKPVVKKKLKLPVYFIYKYFLGKLRG
ncbi:MAG: hypothetical protein LBI03_06905 [Clostridiales bacterium]|jgi:hypothetical protein|nr:hypothetical protein [Clostridiales bacterium]